MQTKKENAFLSVQMMILVVLETLFSFLLKNDPVLKIKARPLFERQAVIHINSYIPFFDIYLQFTDKGLLLDTNQPHREIDLSLRTDLMSLVKIFMHGNVRAIRSMKSKGDVYVKDQFQDLLLLCVLPKIILSIPQWFKQFYRSDSDVTVKEMRIQPLLETLEKQRETIGTLKQALTEAKEDNKQLRNRVRMLKWSIFMLGLLLFIVFGILLHNLYTLA